MAYSGAASVGVKRSRRAVLTPKFIAPVSPFITESIFSVLRNRKKYELHIGLHLKSIISRVANSVINGLDPETRRNEARRSDRGGGFLGGGSEPPPHQLEGLGERCKLPN